MPVNEKKEAGESGHTPSRLQHELFAEGVVSRQVLDAVPSPILIIDPHWRIIYANKAILSLVDQSNAGAGSGLMEGEAFHCVHARNKKSDDQEYASCQVCGIARVLSRSLNGEETCEDCQLNCDLGGKGSNLSLRVGATPLTFHGEHFSILSLVDLSDKQRRKMLENACFHDLLNTLTSIRGVLSVMKDGTVENDLEICDLLERMTQNSIDEITSLRLLEKVRQKEIKPNLVSVDIPDLLNLVRQSFLLHPAAEGKSLELAEELANRIVNSDRQLLQRVVGNMIVNALEATDCGGTVTMGARVDDGHVTIWVHNEGQIPLDIQAQIFRGDCSSKGHGRGIGTYSIKLLSSILGGDARFMSNPKDGTVFSVSIPLQPSPP